jgi:hypothetical protein
MAGPTKSRRFHSKSRAGCAECKRRHVKCDEQRPVCIQCTVSQRSCSYIQLVPNLLEPQSTVSPSIEGPSPSPSTTPRQLDQVSDRYFTIAHFVLFNHVTTYIDDWLAISESMRPFSRLYIRIALESPAVMHQLLAIAALHLGHLDRIKSDSYRDMAAASVSDSEAVSVTTIVILHHTF